jgi:hypothetical protein
MKLPFHQAALLGQCEVWLSRGRIERRHFMAFAIGLEIGGPRATTMAGESWEAWQAPRR